MQAVTDKDVYEAKQVVMWHATTPTLADGIVEAGAIQPSVDLDTGRQGWNFPQGEQQMESSLNETHAPIDATCHACGYRWSTDFKIGFFGSSYDNPDIPCPKCDSYNVTGVDPKAKQQTEEDIFDFVVEEKLKFPPVAAEDGGGGDNMETDSKVQLDPQFFDDENHLQGDVREVLLKIADDVVAGLDEDGIKLEPTFVVLTGSLLGPNWDTQSDVDFHIGVDFESYEEPGVMRVLFGSRARDWNNRGYHLLGRSLELYFQDDKEEHTAPAIYDVVNDVWMQEPDPGEKIDITTDIRTAATDYLQQVNDLIEVYEDLPKEGIVRFYEEIVAFWQSIREMRKEGLNSPEGRASKGNQVFKQLRRNAALEKLVNLLRDVQDDVYDVFRESLEEVDRLATANDYEKLIDEFLLSIIALTDIDEKGCDGRDPKAVYYVAYKFFEPTVDNFAIEHGIKSETLERFWRGIARMIGEMFDDERGCSSNYESGD